MTVITRVVYVQPEKKNGSNAFQEIEQDSAGFFNFQPNSSIDQRKLCSAPLPHLTTINNVIDRGYSKQQCLLASDSTTTGLGNNPKPISYMCLAADTTTIKLAASQDTSPQPTSLLYRQPLATDCLGGIGAGEIKKCNTSYLLIHPLFHLLHYNY